jgi:hypothetical protein
MKVIPKKLSNGKTIYIEVTSYSESEGKVGKLMDALDVVDQAFDHLVQNEITEYCNILIGAFENVKGLPIPPKKAQAEFGLQCNGEGNVYIAKISAQANFKIAFEWEL